MTDEELRHQMGIARTELVHATMAYVISPTKEAYARMGTAMDICDAQNEEAAARVRAMMN